MDYTCRLCGARVPREPRELVDRHKVNSRLAMTGPGLQEVHEGGPCSCQMFDSAELRQVREMMNHHHHHHHH
jgi:hypothetical protein